jgi:hypothetical protein
MTNGEFARGRIPAWVWGLAGGYACLPALLHAWLKYFPHSSGISTGLQGADSVVFLHCLRMFTTGFYSPFASCHAAHGDRFIGYYATPFYWLYGVAGWIGSTLGVDEFMTLGITNGAAVFVYLLAAYVFLREALPRRANLAFVLLALGGGPGGIAYLFCSVLGWTDLPSFESYFQRYSMSLTEGSTMVMAPRLYYTIPLALCLSGLTLFLRAERRGSQRLFWWGAVLLAAGTFFNLRVGPMAWTAGLLYLWFGAQGSARTRAIGAAVATLGLVAGWAVGWWTMSLSPTYTQNALQSVRNSLPFSTYIADMALFLLLLAIALAPAYRSLPKLGQVAASALLGYLVVYTILYVAYQTYYGNWLVAREYAVTIAISDWALSGVVAGLAWGVWRVRTPQPVHSAAPTGWVLLWYLLFFAVSISAFGHGWFMRLVPARLLAFMGLPLCMLAAEGIGYLYEKRPRLARGAVGALVTCGVTTLAVAYSCFMGPCGWRADNQAFAWAHCELMTPSDAHVIAAINSGTVLTPYIPGPQFSDVISLRPGSHVVLGMGTLNMSDLDPKRVEGDVGRFFSADVPQVERRRIIEDWCVDYVFCSDTRPPDADVVAALRATPWLTVVAEEGRAVLFRVNSV